MTEDPFTAIGIRSTRVRAHDNLAPLQSEDYRYLLSLFAILGWCALAGAIVFRLLFYFSGSPLWPRDGGFSFGYNLLCLEFALVSWGVTHLLHTRRWVEDFRAKTLARYRAILIFYVGAGVLHVMAALHMTGSTGGPAMLALAALLLAAFLFLPSRGALNLASFIIGSYAILLLCERRGILSPEPPLGEIFDPATGGPIPRAALFALFFGILFFLAHWARRRLDNLGALLHRPPITDPLTGLFTSDYFEGRLEEELDRARRENEPISLILLEIADFQDLNRRYGFAAGDRILAQLGGEILAAIRVAADAAARITGTRFAVLLPGAGSEGARKVAERLDAYAHEIELGPQRAEEVSLSLGVAITAHPKSVGAQELLSTALKNLTKAKEGGADRIEITVLRPLGETRDLEGENAAAR